MHKNMHRFYSDQSKTENNPNVQQLVMDKQMIHSRNGILWKSITKKEITDKY